MIEILAGIIVVGLGVVAVLALLMAWNSYRRRRERRAALEELIALRAAGIEIKHGN